jgi:hypothetical protein
MPHTIYSRERTFHSLKNNVEQDLGGVAATELN